MHGSERSIGRLLTAAVFGLMFGSGTAEAAACAVPSILYPTIQAAINDPTCNPINVAAGVYAENVFVNRTVVLNGAQAGVDARGRVASESTVTPLVPATRTLELRTGSAGSVIDGFEFAGGTRAIESSSGPIDGIQILNNRILGFTTVAYFSTTTASTSPSIETTSTAQPRSAPAISSTWIPITSTASGSRTTTWRMD